MFLGIIGLEQDVEYSKIIFWLSYKKSVYIWQIFVKASLQNRSWPSIVTDNASDSNVLGCLEKCISFSKREKLTILNFVIIRFKYSFII